MSMMKSVLDKYKVEALGETADVEVLDLADAEPQVVVEMFRHVVDGKFKVIGEYNMDRMYGLVFAKDRIGEDELHAALAEELDLDPDDVDDLIIDVFSR